MSWPPHTRATLSACAAVHHVHLWLKALRLSQQSHYLGWVSHLAGLSDEDVEEFLTQQPNCESTLSKAAAAILSNNALMAMPPLNGKYAAWANVVLLDLNNNELESFPEEAIKDMRGVQELHSPTVCVHISLLLLHGCSVVCYAELCVFQHCKVLELLAGTPLTKTVARRPSFHALAHG